MTWLNDLLVVPSVRSFQRIILSIAYGYKWKNTGVYVIEMMCYKLEFKGLMKTFQFEIEQFV